VGSIDYLIDRPLRRIVIRFVGEVDGHALQAAMAKLWDEFPDIASCDSLCDMRCFTGDIGFDDISAVADAWRLFCGGKDRGRRTAIVSRDRFASLLVQAIALRFGGRELAVFHTIDEAAAWLDRTA